MRSKYGDYTNLAQCVEQRFPNYAGIAESKKCSLERARLWRQCQCERRPTTSLPMVGFGQVCQLEIHRKGFRQLCGIDNSDAAYDVDPGIDRGLARAPGDRECSKILDGVEEILSFLFSND